MITIADIEQKIRERDAEIVTLEARIEAAEEELGRANERKETVKNGNYPAFKAATEAVRDLETELEWAKSRLVTLRTTPGISIHDANEAWALFTDKYDAEFDRKYAAYERKRNELLSDFKALIDLQNKAFSIREKLSGYIGYVPVPSGGGPLYRPYDNRFPCHTLPDKFKGPDFTKHKFLENADACFYINAVSDHDLAEEVKYSMRNHTATFQ